MAPKRRPETQKIPELVVRPQSKRSRSPGEPEPEAKHLCVKRPGTACDCCCFPNSAIWGCSCRRLEWGWGAPGSRGMPRGEHFVRRLNTPPALMEFGFKLAQVMGRGREAPLRETQRGFPHSSFVPGPINTRRAPWNHPTWW